MRHRTLGQVTAGQILPSNSGSFTVISVGSGPTFLHSPTGVQMPVGTVIRNSAGWYGTMDSEGGFTWTQGFPTQESLARWQGPEPMPTSMYVPIAAPPTSKAAVVYTQSTSPPPPPAPPPPADYSGHNIIKQWGWIQDAQGVWRHPQTGATGHWTDGTFVNDTARKIFDPVTGIVSDLPSAAPPPKGTTTETQSISAEKVAADKAAAETTGGAVPSEIPMWAWIGGGLTVLYLFSRGR